MARQRNFDSKEVTKKALDVFWVKGYYNTSVEDLVESLQIGRGSLYNAFGSKHDLFIKTLDYYINSRKTLLETKLKTSSIKEGFTNYMNDTIAEILLDNKNKGCFVVNTMTELAKTDSEVLSLLIKSEKQLVNCFYDALCFGKKSGELTFTYDEYSLALFISNTMKGLRVYSKVSKSREELQSIVKITLDLIK